MKAGSYYMCLISVVLLIAAEEAKAGEFPEMYLELSASALRDDWGDAFFHKVWTQPQGMPLQIPDFNRTIWFYSYPDIGIGCRISRYLNVKVKWQQMDFVLRDALTLSYTRWQKRLDASLHFFSLGAYLSFRPFPIYAGAASGYCTGKLVTDQLFEIPGEEKNWISAEGRGGGLFYDFVLGTRFPVSGVISTYIELGYRLTPEWKRFSVDEVHEDIQEDYQWLIEEDRNIRIRGFQISGGFGIRL